MAAEAGDSGIAVDDGTGSGEVAYAFNSGAGACVDFRCMDIQALWLTLKLAASTTAILLVIALPLAWWIASGHSVARALVQAFVALPLVLPPTVLGFYLLILLGPLTRSGSHADTSIRASAGVQLWWITGGVVDLQPAVRGTAVGGRVQGSRYAVTLRRRKDWAYDRFVCFSP